MADAEPQASRSDATDVTTAEHVDVVEGEIPKVTGFKKFPAEIRQKIWDLVLNDTPAKYITISNVGGSQYSLLRPWLKSEGYTTFDLVYKPKATGQYEVPALLSVNSEARARAKKHYYFTMEKQFDMPIYYNPKIDTLVIESFEALLGLLGGVPSGYNKRLGSPPSDKGDQDIVQSVLDTVRRLAIQGEFANMGKFGHMLPFFKHLESLSVIKSVYHRFNTRPFIQRGIQLHGPNYTFPVPEEYTKIQMEKLALGIPLNQRIKRKKRKA